jgi:anaerobic ribonucleoside-triphosphate reductase
MLATKIKEAKCEKCGSKKVSLITRVVGYLSNLSSWNRSKLAELQDRRRGNYTV